MRLRQGDLPAPQRRRTLLRPPQTLPRTRHPLRKTRRSLPERGDHRQPHLVAQPRSTKQALVRHLSRSVGVPRQVARPGPARKIQRVPAGIYRSWDRAVRVRFSRLRTWRESSRVLGDAGTSLMAAIHPRRSSDAQVLWALREQEALRLVATLVARGASSSTALSLVVRELGRLLGAGYASIGRFESDATICNLAYWRDPSAPDIDPPFGGR